MEFAARAALLVGVLIAGDAGAGAPVADTGPIASLYNDTSLEVDWGHLLPDSVQGLLPQILGKYGHLDALEDPNTNAFLHALLPDAGELGNESSLPGSTEDLEALMDSAAAEEAAASEAAERRQQDALKERDTERSKQAAEVRLAQEERLAAEDLASESRSAPALAAVEAARAKDHAALEAFNKREQNNFARMKREHEENLSKQRERSEASRKQFAAKMEEHAKLGERMEQILMMVHDQIEEDSHGFSDMPFWDDFFRNTSAREGWSRLNLEGLGPALNLPALRPEHQILVLEPSESLGVAAQLAESLQATGVLAASHSYGAEPDGAFDVVLELGLLDAMAMGNAGGAKTHRLEELRRASHRLSDLLRPGGAWVSVSSVPPGLRLPLLERLAGGAFDAPSEEVGTHTVKLGVVPAQAARSLTAPVPPKLRGAGLDSQRVANLLLYGHREPHVFAYRLPRVEASWTDSAFGASALPALEGIVAAQRSAEHDDL